MDARQSMSDICYRTHFGVFSDMSANGTDSQYDRNPRQHKNVFVEERHKEHDRASLHRRIDQWRIRERMKTVSVALVLCLNVGVDPPDVIKIAPCARQECWVDPHSIPPQKAAESIGKAIQFQYERWQPRARYKVCLDPTVDSIKTLCTSMRRSSKEERILFHYNGHGVPKPTDHGEIWVFNKDFTQYIPLPIYNIQQWLEAPSIYVFDCNNAGVIVRWFHKFSEKRRQERVLSVEAGTNDVSEDYILLAACGINENLPTTPTLPADVFTSCLTTPIKIALKWLALQTIITGVTSDMVDQIPGRLTDRRTPLGELNWIFTAVTDTIAWTVLPKHLFQKLFRQDLLVACLFRNFLLAERLLRSCKCVPISFPKLPLTYSHPMWLAWDLAADHCLAQLPKLIDNPNTEFKHCTFFSEQLTAFEVWLEFGTEDKPPPEQLPIVLQVLLSQQHRMRALILLSKFLDLGPWAVNQGLSVGIFPYVLKLLQSTAMELCQTLVFIWAKILAVDKSCQFDLVKENGQVYFISVLSNSTLPAAQRAQAAFVLSVICDGCRPGQISCLNAKLISICLSQLGESDNLLRRWVVLTLAKLWENYDEAKEVAIKEAAHDKLCLLLTDPVPEVRAAAVCALGTFIGNAVTPRNNTRSEAEFKLGLTLPVVTIDSSPMVRKELAITLASLVNVYYDPLVEEVKRQLKAEHVLFGSSKISSVHGHNSTTRDATYSPYPPLDAPSSLNQNLKHINLASGDDNSIEASGGSMCFDSSMEKGMDEQSSVYEFICKVVRSLSVDPVMSVAVVARHILYHLRVSAQKQFVSSASGGYNSTADALVDSDKIRREASPTNLGSGFMSLANSKQSQSATNLGYVAPGSSNSNKESTYSGSSYIASFASSLLARKTQNPLTVSASNHRSDEQFDSLEIDTNSAMFLSMSPLLSDGVFTSTYYDWCCLYFSSPLMRSNGDESAGCPDRRWRQHFNGRMEDVFGDSSSRNLAECKVGNEIAMLENDSSTIKVLVFHPFEPIICVADESRGISVWNWEEGVKVNYINNHKANAKMASLHLLNENYMALIAAGSNDGVVRIWSGLHSNSRMVTAWHALPDVPPLSAISGPGLVLDWGQRSGYLYASGNVDLIRVWDLNKELSVQDISTGSDSPLTCMVSDRDKDDRLIISGCANGIIRLYDARQCNKFNPVAVYDEHKGNSIVNMSVTKSTEGQVLSAASNGEIKFWDLRATRSIMSIAAPAQSHLTAFAVYEQAPIMATGTQDQRIKVMNFVGDELSVIRYHYGFLGQRIGPVSCLAFHPYYTLLGAGSTDSLVSIYAGDKFKIRSG